MGTIGNVLPSLSPHALLRLYLVVVVGAAVLAIGAVFWTMSRVDSSSREAASLANTAAATSQVQADLRDPLMVMLINSGSFLLSSDLAEIVPEELRADLLSSLTGGISTFNLELLFLPEVDAPMSDSDAVELHGSIEAISGQVDEILRGAPDVDFSSVVAERDAVVASSSAYFENDSLTNFAALFRDVISLGEELNATSDVLAVQVAVTQANLSEATSTARIAMVTALVFLTMLMGAATFFVGRLLTKAFRSGETERNALRETTETLSYRNSQLNALNTVFSEITDTLSMRYVVSATLRETLRVINGSFVVLRLVQDGKLVAVGNLTKDGEQLSELPTVEIGEGPVGRVARRGRSLRIDREAREQLTVPYYPEEVKDRVQSGIITPLIVGARVVGTLAVWADEPGAFSDEDEHVLEMMASQVATAVVAADHAENSERRALHDPLTGLPNRLQLSEDVAGVRDKSAQAAIAMIDIDNFKKVNDEYGHRVGDLALQRIGEVMRRAMREGDRIYRFGGEEFMAVFDGASGRDAVVAAERLRAAVESDTTLTELGIARSITVSLGIALKPAHGEDFGTLIEKADRAMYRAKDRGRNRVELWDEDPAGSVNRSVA